MKLEGNDLDNYRQLHFSLCGLKQVDEELLQCTKGLDTIGNRGLTWSQGDGHRARRRVWPIGELLALMLRANTNQPVYGGYKAL